MEVNQVPLTDDIKAALQPSLDCSGWDWPKIEKWMQDRVAAVWQIGGQAWAVTAANIDGEVDIIVGGGRGAIRATRPFLKAMESLPAHKGLTLRIEGRRGWKRFCDDWQCEEVGGGDIIMTKRL